MGERLRGYWDILVVSFLGRGRGRLSIVRHFCSIFSLLLLHLIITKQKLNKLLYKTKVGIHTYAYVVVVVILNYK